MASLRSCCVTGHIREGTPQGEIIHIGGVEAYIAKPKEASQKAVVISTDVFGHRHPNVQLIADAFAKEGFLTVIPDLFNGGPLPASFMDALPKIAGIPGHPAGPPSFFSKITTILSLAPSMVWFYIRNPPSKKAPILEQTIREVKANFGSTKLGMIGYCYGGTPLLMVAKNEGALDAFVVAHTQVSVPADINTNKAPGLILAAESDFAFPDKARDQANEIIEKEHLADRMRIKFFPGTYHGFAIRGDDKVELIAKAKEEAFHEACQWFKDRLV